MGEKSRLGTIVFFFFPFWLESSLAGGPPCRFLQMVNFSRPYSVGVEAVSSRRALRRAPYRAAEITCLFLFFLITHSCDCSRRVRKRHHILHHTCKWPLLRRGFSYCRDGGGCRLYTLKRHLATKARLHLIDPAVFFWAQKEGGEINRRNPSPPPFSEYLNFAGMHVLIVTLPSRAMQLGNFPESLRQHKNDMCKFQ